MKKISGILIALLLAVISLFGFVGCVSSSQSELQSKIEELQSRIEELEEQIQERDERIKELEEENIGTFYTLQEAYNNGILTKEDLKVIATTPRLELADITIKQAIIKDYLKMFLEHTQSYHDATVEDIYIYKYFGDYNGAIVIQITEVFVEYPAVMMEYTVADIVIEYSGPEILVWKELVRG